MPQQAIESAFPASTLTLQLNHLIQRTNSTRSPKANTTFKTKQKLPYTLLCDPAQSLISAIGLKKAAKGTTRGVFVVDKKGKVLAAEPGGPAKTLEIVRKAIGEGASGATKEDVEAAKTAAEVADTAAKVDEK
ncbi:hypothetical protein J1614_004058 [Plenodomus biglobosus]|nr:hypothetical protein J1614_004058 [Plenodomus biglobosus]